MKLRSEKGSITVYVLVALFFLMAIIVGRFIIANRNLKVQYDSLAKIKNLYETNTKRYEIYEDPDNPGGNNPGSSGNPGGTTGENGHQIYIFNAEAFRFFNGKLTGTDRIYVYQVGLYYILKEKDNQFHTDVLVKDSYTYKLMSDITLSESNGDVINWPVMGKLDFNNHIIYTDAYNKDNKDDYSNRYYDEYIFFDGEKPASGKVSQ